MYKCSLSAPIGGWGSCNRCKWKTTEREKNTIRSYSLTAGTCSLCANVFSKSTRTISSAERLCQKSFYQTYRNHTLSSRAGLACQVQRTSVGHRDTGIKGDHGSNISHIFILWKLLSPHHRHATAQAGQTAWFPSYKNIHWWWISFWMSALDTWHEFLWMKSICDSRTLSLRTVCFNQAL